MIFVRYFDLLHSNGSNKL